MQEVTDSVTKFVMREPTEIHSLQHPLVNKAKLLHRTAHRKELQSLLIEGTHSLQEAVAAEWPIEAIFYTADWKEGRLVDLAAMDGSAKQFLVSPQVLKKMVTTDHPDGVVAIAPRRQPSADRIPEFHAALLLDSVQDPGNVGTLVRVAAATGLGPVFLCNDCASFDHPKVVRSSAGQWFRATPREVSEESLLQHCKRLAIPVLAACADGNPYWETDLSGPVLIALGNEGAGLNSNLLAQARQSVSIPMSNAVESLNVAMTGTLLMYESLRQRTQFHHKR